MGGTARAPSEGAASGGVDEGEDKAREFGRERVVEIQRARILAAMVEVSAEHGVANVTVAQVVGRSGVSRRTFYELFGDREECFLAAFDDGVARASRYILESYDPGARWAERIRTALTGLLCFLGVERDAGRLLLVESLGAGAKVLERRRRVLAQMIALVDEGRGVARAGEELPLLRAEGVVGAVSSVIHARLLERNADRLAAPLASAIGDSCVEELLNPLMSMIVLPYLGPAAARRELERPTPKRPLVDRGAVGDPWRDLGMRLTYRTVRVLLSVAAAPGSSNRQIGVASGITDQGQMSKLLSRLQGVGLVENTGLAPGSGAPNAWTLTARGWEVQRTISTKKPGSGR